MANDGGYKSRNGAKDAPIHRNTADGDGISLGDDFPILCETCLGPNPYVRMVKMPYGQKLCKISNAPYQAFRWKAGPGGRYKETIISYIVAKERNICQTCLNDLQYGLPVGVRDKLLSQAGNGNQIALPHSEVGTRYFYEQQSRIDGDSTAQDAGFAHNMQNLAPSRQLQRFSRVMQVTESHNKTAFRNLPKLCSFWVAGQCTRVLKKSCPFRPCCGTYLFPEIAGAQKEMCSELIAALEKDGPAVLQKKLSNDVRIALKDAQKGNRDDAIKKRVTGEDDLSHKYLNKMKTMNMELEPPEDPSICTLWVGNMDPELVEADLYEAFFPCGTVASIHLVPQARCAFVEMSTRADAENAARQLYGALMVRGRALSMHWARPRAPVSAQLASVEGAGDDGLLMLAPPGLEAAPTSAYSLGGVAPPGIDGRPTPPAPPPPQGRRRDDSRGDGEMDPPAKRMTIAPPAPYPYPQTPVEQMYSHAPVRNTARAPAYPSMDPLRMGTSFGGGRGGRGSR